jgi:hypothetical protein
MVLKPNMVLLGALCTAQVTTADIAEATVECLRRIAPAAVPGVAFLSGGRTATASRRTSAWDRNGSSLFKGEVGWLQREPIFGSGRILSKRAVAPAEDLVTWPKPRHARANGLNLTRHISASNGVLWLAQTVQGKRAGDIRQTAHDRPVTRVHGSSPSSKQHFIVPDPGRVDVPEFQDVR